VDSIIPAHQNGWLVDNALSVTLSLAPSALTRFVWEVTHWPTSSSLSLSPNYKLGDVSFQLQVSPPVGRDPQPFAVILRIYSTPEKRRFYVTITIQSLLESVVSVADFQFACGGDQCVIDFRAVFFGSVLRSKSALRLAADVKLMEVARPVVSPARTITDDSKKESGFVGLKNQGATCYMNSMLQSLFCTSAFRKLVYAILTTGSEDVNKCIPLTLQHLFCRMQTGDKACSTSALTRSFGWSDWDTFVQHDVQEFCCVLMDNLEEKMKGTPLQGRVASLFRGKTQIEVRALHVDFENVCEDDFYDLSLVVKDVPDLASSFAKYTETDTLTGDNRYDTEKFGKQEVDIGTKFLEFPPILHLHLRRFEYSNDYARMTKINSKFEFPETIDLSPFMAPNHGPQR
jgi:ubiquitin carboxyl-terminal hydrolase 7